MAADMTARRHPSQPVVAAALVLAGLLAAGCSSQSTLSSAPATDSDLPATGVSTDDGGTTTTTVDPGEGEGEGDEPEEPDGPEAEGLSPASVDALALPDSAVDLAPALSEAEAELRRDGAADPDQQALTSAWGRRQQLLYRVLAAHPDWADQVVAEVDPEIAPAVEANWAAQTELTALVRTYTLSPTVPAWRIIEPDPADELLGYYQDASDVTGVPWETLAAIHLIETRMGRIEGVSTAGAVGPMQFLPATWEECCEGDPTVTADAIQGAATYLVRRGAPDDMDRALKGYNTSDHYVAAVKQYASVMTADPETYHAYHAWEVHFLSSAGLIHLPVGYEQAEPVDAAVWAADHPDDLLPQPPPS